MALHSIFVIGGNDGESILLGDEAVDQTCRLTCVVRDETHHAEAEDYFEALQIIRRRILEPRGLIPICYGASLNVWPSGMSRDMGRGRKAYKKELGAPATDLVGIFEVGPDVIPATVARQEEFHSDWIASILNR